MTAQEMRKSLMKKFIFCLVDDGIFLLSLSYYLKTSKRNTNAVAVSYEVSLHIQVFSPNTGKYEPEKCRMRKNFTQ